MARDFPDVGQSPIDAYMSGGDRPCAFFEHQIKGSTSIDRAAGLYIKVQDRSSVSQTAFDVSFDLHSSASKSATQYVQGQTINMYVQSDVYVAAGLRVNAYTRDKYVPDTNPTMTQFFGIDVQLDDMGNAVSYIAGINISRTVVDVGTSVDAFIRMSGVGATTVFNLHGGGIATYLLEFASAATPYSSGSDSTNCDGKIAIKVPAGLRYLHTFTD